MVGIPPRNPGMSARDRTPARHNRAVPSNGDWPLLSLAAPIPSSSWSFLWSWFPGIRRLRDARPQHDIDGRVCGQVRARRLQLEHNRASSGPIPVVSTAADADAPQTKTGRLRATRRFVKWQATEVRHDAGPLTHHDSHDGVPPHMPARRRVLGDDHADRNPHVLPALGNHDAKSHRPNGLRGSHD